MDVHLIIGGSPATPKLGARVLGRGGDSGEVVASITHGEYYEAAYRQRLYSVANSASLVTSVGTATTYLGLVLANPIGSKVNLAVSAVSAVYNVAVSTTGILGLMVGSATTNVTLTTPVTTVNGSLGSTPGSAVAASSATLPVTPTFWMPLQMIVQIATLGEVVQIAPFDLRCALIVTPGSFVAFYTSAAASTFVGFFQWEETPFAS